MQQACWLARALIGDNAADGVTLMAVTIYMPGQVYTEQHGPPRPALYTERHNRLNEIFKLGCWQCTDRESGSGTARAARLGLDADAEGCRAQIQVGRSGGRTSLRQPPGS